MSYVKRAVYGTSLVFIMSILDAIVAYISRIVMARNLTPEEYGLFTAVFTFITFFLFFRDLGMGHALSKYIPEYIVKGEHQHIKSGIVFVFIFQIISSSILAIILLILAPFLAEQYFKNPLAKPILLLLLLYVFGSPVFRMFRHISGGFQKMKLFSIFEFLKNSIVLLILLILFYFNTGIYAPAIAYALVCYIVVVITFPFMWKMYPLTKYKMENFKKVSKNLFIFGMPIFATSIAGKIISYVDILILTYYRSLTEVGVYNVILPSAMIFLHFGSSVSVVIFPMFSELWTKKDSRRMTEALRLIQKYSFVIILPAALVAISSSKLLIETFFGAEYVSGTLSLQILIIGMLFYVVAGINNHIISAIGQPKTVAKIIILAMIFNFILNIIIIPIWGIEGAALTTTFSYLMVLILSTNRVVHYIPFKYPKMVWVKLIFAGFVFFSIIKYIREILVIKAWGELFISVGIATLVYAGIVYAYGIINFKEVKKYFRILRKKN